MFDYYSQSYMCIKPYVTAMDRHKRNTVIDNLAYVIELLSLPCNNIVAKYMAYESKDVKRCLVPMINEDNFTYIKRMIDHTVTEFQNNNDLRLDKIYRNYDCIQDTTIKTDYRGIILSGISLYCCINGNHIRYVARLNIKDTISITVTSKWYRPNLVCKQCGRMALNN